MTDSLQLARQRESRAREQLHLAAQNLAADVCDDAWMTAAILETLLDDERARAQALRQAAAELLAGTMKVRLRGTIYFVRGEHIRALEDALEVSPVWPGASDPDPDD